MIIILFTCLFLIFSDSVTSHYFSMDPNKESNLNLKRINLKQNLVFVNGYR